MIQIIVMRTKYKNVYKALSTVSGTIKSLNNAITSDYFK